MQKKWRAAVIACGRMARAHGNAFAALPDVELVALADVSPEALQSFGDTYGVPESGRYTDYNRMMDEARPDLVAIVSLHNMHASMTIDVAKYRPKGILCEKPIALSLGEADAMIEACDDAGTVLAIGHQRSYNAQYKAAANALAAGAIGELRSIESHGHPGSSLLVDGTHTVDLVRRYADNSPIEWVMGQIDTREGRSAWGSHVENATVMMFGFASGVRALHTCGSGRVGEELSALWPPVSGPNYHHILLRGSEGEIHIDGDSPTPGRPLVRLVRNGAESEIPLPEHDGPEYLSAVHAQIVQDLITSIETGAEHPLNAPHARATLEVLMAAYESSRQRALIPLPLECAGNPMFEMLGVES